jgi:hypothetical protein
LKLAKK